MTRETMKFLFMKLPKESLIENILSVYEVLFKDSDELKKAYRKTAALIQAREIISGNADFEDFQEPFKTELREVLGALEDRFALSTKPREVNSEEMK